MDNGNIQELIDYLSWLYDSGHKKNFNQKEYLHACGTPACVAGYACALKQNKEEWNKLSSKDIISKQINLETTKTIYNTARNWLGIDEDQADNLFDGGVLGADAYEAVEVLKNLLSTGEVKWSSRTIHADDVRTKCWEFVQSYCRDSYPEDHEIEAIDNLENAFLDGSLPVSILLDGIEGVEEYETKVNELIYG